jgi:hypothetical protein
MTHARKNDKPVAASELIKELQHDPVYLARMREIAQHRQKQLVEHGVAAAPVVNELRKAGFSVDSIDELRRSGAPYKDAVPVLLRWLPVISDLAVKESIVRALSVPWAGTAAARPLLDEFLGTHNESLANLKWAIGNALEIVADDAVFNEIAGLVQDKRHGKSRQMLAAALGNMKNPAAVGLLISLLDDEEIAGHAIIGLGKLRARNARTNIEPFLGHPKAWVRQEARKALAKIGR